MINQMKQASSKYQFETIDSLGMKQMQNSPTYYRLDRTLPISAVPANQNLNSPYASNVRSLDYLKAAQNLQIHRAYENDLIQTKVPELYLGGQQKRQQLARTRDGAQVQEQLSPLKGYTQRLSNQNYHSSPIYSGSLPQQNYNSSPSQPRNIDEQSMYYYRAGDAVPPPPMSYFQSQPISQLVSCQTYINPNHLDHHGAHLQHNHGAEQKSMMDIYSELPRDQCHYCVQNAGMFGTKNSDFYYNKELIEQREQELSQQEQRREKQKADTSYFKNEWEREIEDKKNKKKIKKLDEVKDNVSMESEITRKPQDYALLYQDMSIPEGKEINDLINSEKQKSQIKLGGMFKATLFGKKLKDAAETRKIQNQAHEVEEMLEQQEREIIDFENLQLPDFEHLSDEEKRRLLMYYNQLNMLNEEMKNGQLNSQKSLNAIFKFVDSQISGIQEQVFANGLDNLAKRIMKD